MSEQPTHQKIALVTGANKGIGRAAAEQLAALGVTDPATVQEVAKHVEERFGHLDVLINNAGITGSGQVSPADAYDQVPSTVDLDMVRAVFETNVFGVIAVTNAMLPLLRRLPAPRIVNGSSGAGSLTIARAPDGPLATLPASAAYMPSKSALNSLTVQYANELRKDGTLVNAADPGFVDTEINNHSGYLTPAQGAAVVVRLAMLGADGPTGGFFSEAGSV